MSTTFILLHPDDFTEKTTQKIAYAANNAIQRGAAEVLFPDAEYVKCETREDCLNAAVSGRAIPSNAMTANTFAEDVQASRDAGMNAHIAKPIVMNEVIRTIARTLH